jgi:hypothetical protein
LIRATREEIEAYLKLMGRHGMQTLSTLGKLQPFAECMESDLGKTLLGDLIGRHEELLDKIAELESTEEDRMEFRVVKRIIMDFASKINLYNNRVEVIKKKANV